MAVPKKKVSKSRRGIRRSHNALGKINVVVDATTGEYKLPHHVSLEDGYYKGKQVVAENTEDDSDSDTKKASA